MKSKKETMGFKQAIEYTLSLLCYAYYVKSDNLVSDICFDEIERLYCNMFDEQHAPDRMMEREEAYSNGVRVVYNFHKKQILEKTKGNNNE